jgi:hypothetical protein
MLVPIRRSDNLAYTEGIRKSWRSGVRSEKIPSKLFDKVNIEKPSLVSLDGDA